LETLEILIPTVGCLCVQKTSKPLILLNGTKS
jgi:hypothetical protein